MIEILIKRMTSFRNVLIREAITTMAFCVPPTAMVNVKKTEINMHVHQNQTNDAQNGR